MISATNRYDLLLSVAHHLSGQHLGGTIRYDPLLSVAHLLGGQHLLHPLLVCLPLLAELVLLFGEGPRLPLRLYHEQLAALPLLLHLYDSIGNQPSPIGD
jgi:hypothetical protein